MHMELTFCSQNLWIKKEVLKVSLMPNKFHFIFSKPGGSQLPKPCTCCDVLWLYHQEIQECSPNASNSQIISWEFIASWPWMYHYLISQWGGRQGMWILCGYLINGLLVKFSINTEIIETLKWFIHAIICS